MITIQDVQNMLKDDDYALMYPQEAQRFLQFWENVDEKIMFTVFPDQLDKLWENFLNELQTYEKSAKEMSPTERASQYWDFIYEQMDFAGVDTAGEFFAAENHRTIYD